MTIISLRGFDLDQSERDADDVLAKLRMLNDVAQETGSAPVIAITQERRARAASLRTAARSALPQLLDGESKFTEAFARWDRAKAVVNLGTLDADVAVERAGASIAAHAAAAHYENALPALRTAVSSPLQTIVSMRHDAEAKTYAAVLENTQTIASALFSEHLSELEVANDFGRKAKAKDVLWFPVAEAIVTQAFVAKCKELKAREDAKREYGRTIISQVPKLADLEHAFAARRAAHESARKTARAALEAMEAGQ